MLKSFTFDPKTGEFEIKGRVASQVGEPSSTGKNNILTYIGWQVTDQKTQDGAPVKITATIAIPRPA